MTEQTEVKQAEVPKVDPIENANADKNKPQETISEPENVQEKNWKAFRESREIERKQSEEIARQAKKSQEEAAALKAALDAVLNKPQSNQSYQSSDQPEESEDQRIERLVKDAVEKREAVAEKQRREREIQEYPQKIAREFKDFDSICSAENLDYLDYHYPEVSQAFSHMPEGYDKWATVYKAVKKLIPNVESKKEQAKAEKNFSKPQSISSPGVTQTGNNAAPFRLDEKRKAENYARMQKIMNRLD